MIRGDQRGGEERRPDECGHRNCREQDHPFHSILIIILLASSVLYGPLLPEQLMRWAWVL